MTTEVRGIVGNRITGIAGMIMRAKALNSHPGWAGGIDIKVARQEGFILADASGMVGFNPLNPGQRDRVAVRAKDSDKQIGE